jgi:hypothetical protein
VPPEEDVLPEESADILDELRDDDIEDLSYATMFANALDLDGRPDTQLQRPDEGISERMRMDDLIIECPSTHQVSAAGRLCIRICFSHC